MTSLAQDLPLVKSEIRPMSLFLSTDSEDKPPQRGPPWELDRQEQHMQSLEKIKEQLQSQNSQSQDTDMRMQD